MPKSIQDKKNMPKSKAGPSGAGSKPYNHPYNTRASSTSPPACTPILDPKRTKFFRPEILSSKKTGTAKNTDLEKHRKKSHHEEIQFTVTANLKGVRGKEVGHSADIDRKTDVNEDQQTTKPDLDIEFDRKSVFIQRLETIEKKNREGCNWFGDLSDDEVCKTMFVKRKSHFQGNRSFLQAKT